MAVILNTNGRPASPDNPIDVKTPLFVARESDKKPLAFCRICQARGERSVFYRGEERAYERHVVECSRRNEDFLRKRSLRVQAPALYDPEVSGDVERGKWIRANREALIEGRKKL